MHHFCCSLWYQRVFLFSPLRTPHITSSHIAARGLLWLCRKPGSVADKWLRPGEVNDNIEWTSEQLNVLVAAADSDDPQVVMQVQRARGGERERTAVSMRKELAESQKETYKKARRALFTRTCSHTCTGATWYPHSMHAVVRGHHACAHQDSAHSLQSPERPSLSGCEYTHSTR